MTIDVKFLFVFDSGTAYKYDTTYKVLYKWA